jgi:hypothetical protein
MAKSTKVVKLLESLSEEIVNVDSLLTDDQVEALKDSECDAFKLTGIAVSAYREAELTEEQALELASAEKEKAELAASQQTKENAVRVTYLKKQIAAIEKADPSEHGMIVAKLDAKKAHEIKALAATILDEREKLVEKIRKLANVKILAAEQAIKDHYGFDGSTSASKTIRPPMIGNDWLILDLLTKLDGVKSIRVQWYLDAQGTFYAMPIGSDWFKSQARPFELKENEWTQIVTLPGESLASASFVQALCYDAMYHMRERKSVDDLAAYMTGIVTNDNVSTQSTGGSRNVWHCVPEKQDPGYARQIFGDDLAKYNLPVTNEEPNEEPAK